MLRRLVWLEFRQARPIAIGLTLAGIGFIVLFALSPARQVTDLVTLLLVGLAAAVCGAAAFQKEGPVVNHRFLADRGASPAGVWFPKQLVWGGAAAATMVVLVLSGVLLFPGSREGTVWNASSAQSEILAIGAVVALNFYSASQWVSAVCRRGLESLLLGLFAGIALFVVTLALWSVLGLDQWDVRFSGLLLGVPMPALLAVLTFVRTDDWLLSRRTRSARVRYAANLSLPLLVVPVALAVWRALEVPDIGEPFPVSEVLDAAVPAPENAAPLYLQAVEMLTPDPYQSSKVDKKALLLAYEAILRDGWPDGTMPASDATELWSCWVVANQQVAAVVQEADGKARCLFTAPADVDLFAEGPATRLAPLVRFLELDARRLEHDGDLAAALDRHLSVLHLAGRLCNRAPVYEFITANEVHQHALEALDAWMARPAQTPELLRRAIRELERQPDPSVDLVEAIQVEYLLFDRFKNVEGTNYDVTSHGKRAWLWLRWWCALPWERTRERRVRNLATAGSLVEARAEPVERYYEWGGASVWRRVSARFPTFRAGHPPRAFTTAQMQYYLATTPMANLAPDAAAWNWLQLMDMDRALQRAALITLARSVYTQERGVWPDRLDALVGTYLDAIPADPFSDRAEGKQPFLYRISPGERLRVGGHDYQTDPGEPILYSRGFNQKDDHGRIHWRSREDGRSSLGSDFVFLIPSHDAFASED